MLFQEIFKSKKILFVSTLLAFILYSCDGGATESNTPPPTNETPPKKEVKQKPKKLSLGQKAFILCQACHSVKKGDAHKVGPNLNGLFGKKAGTTEGFTYSDAIKKSNIVWDANHLRNWLEKPTDYIPGTTMAFVGIEDKAQQDALIKYLEEVTK